MTETTGVLSIESVRVTAAVNCAPPGVLDVELAEDDVLIVEAGGKLTVGLFSNGDVCVYDEAGNPLYVAGPSKDDPNNLARAARALGVASGDGEVARAGTSEAA